MRETVIWTDDELGCAEQRLAEIMQQISDLSTQFHAEKQDKHQRDEPNENYPEKEEIERIKSYSKEIKDRISEARVYELGSLEANKHGLGDIFKITDEDGSTMFYHVRGSYCIGQTKTYHPDHMGISVGSPIHDWYLQELRRQGLKPGQNRVIEIAPLSRQGTLRIA